MVNYGTHYNLHLLNIGLLGFLIFMFFFSGVIGDLTLIVLGQSRVFNLRCNLAFKI